MVDKTSHMFITGPDVIKTVTGEDVSLEELGGARTHNTHSGNAHYLATDEDDAIDYVRELLSYLPSNNLDDAAGRRPPATPAAWRSTDDDLALDTLIPDSAEPAVRHARRHPARPRRRGVPARSRPLYAQNIVVGFGRVEGASGRAWWPTSRCTSPAPWTSTPPRRRPGSSGPATRSTFPVLTFVDVPGFLPGTDQEWNGIIRRGAKLIYAYAEATVPMITVITRKAYGGAYDVMGSKHLGADVNLAWPTAQIAVMGAQGAVNILYRQELAARRGPGRAARAELRRGVRGHPGQPVHRGRARLRRRGHPAVRDPGPGHPGAADAPHQAADPPAEEAREHPALTVSCSHLTTQRSTQAVLPPREVRVRQ